MALVVVGPKIVTEIVYSCPDDFDCLYLSCCCCCYYLRN